ncbi:MAG: protein jag [Oscillospiraceae bacterium]|nr:protein jag [Oscillospiraceae bacterium]
MQKFIEMTGKTEDAAIAAALEKLGLSREEVSVEVLELAKPGFLGIGGTLAKVRVSYEGPDEELVEEPVVQEAPKAAPAEQEAPKAEDTAPAEAPAAPEKSAAAPADDDVSAKIVDFLTGLLSRLEVNAQAQVSVDGEGNYLVELVGEGLGAIIGRRGETLDAIQQLTGYAVNRGQQKRVRVRIDAEGYRAKREESLERMALRVADKVVRYRRNMTLEPMNAYERHVVHTALQGKPDISTYSVGVEPNRRTVVAYTPGENR